MVKAMPQTDKDTRVAKFLFWCLAPLLFAAFMRLFVLVFYFIYGSALIWLFGEQYKGFVHGAALVTASGFAAATLVYLYRQFRFHILDER